MKVEIWKFMVSVLGVSFLGSIIALYVFNFVESAREELKELNDDDDFHV